MLYELYGMQKENFFFPLTQKMGLWVYSRKQVMCHG